MNGMRTGGALSILALLLLAGCAGGKTKDGDPVDPSSSVAAPGDAIPDAGSIHAVVVNDEQLPIEGATVGVVNPPVQAVTDAAGAAILTNLPPGAYNVFAQRLGYESAPKRVDVLANQETTVRFVLVASPVEEAYHRTLGPYIQFMTCGLSRVAVGVVYVGLTTGPCHQGVDAARDALEDAFGESNNTIRFQMTEEVLDALVVETHWRPSAVGTANRLLTSFSYEGRGGGHWWCASAGTSPTRFTYSTDEDVESCANKGGTDNPEVPLKKHKLIVFSNVDFVRPTSTSSPSFVDIAIGQEFETVVTMFYREQPEPEFSGFPDG